MEDKILRRVRGLLAQAEDPAATPQEAEAFSRKAEELIARYAIDTALLEAKDHRRKPNVRKFEAPDPYGKPKAALLTGIAMVHDCKVIRHGDGSLTLIGFEGDLDVVGILYTSLLLQGSHAVVNGDRSDRSFRTAFWYGFAGRVHERLTEFRARAVQEAEEAGAYLEVLADRKNEVDAYVREQFPNLRSSGRIKVRSRDGYRSGISAANRADIGGSCIGGGARAALG